jgi:hypothetical protein
MRLLTSFLLLSCLWLSSCTIVGTEDEQTTNMRKELIHRAVRDHANEIGKCYSYEATKDPKFSTKILMEWEIDSEGHPQKITATTVEPNKNPETFNKCLVDVFTEITFPPSTKGQEMKVKFPLMFSPEGSKK